MTDFLANVCPSPTFSPEEDLDENEVTWVWKRAHAGVPARKQPIAFDKIRDRLFKLKQSIETFCGHKLHINIDEIGQHVVSKAFSGITTSELDEIAATYAGSCVKHPDYTHFSGCLLLSNLRANLRYLLKDDRLSFESFAEYAYNYIDDRGENTPLISKEVYELARKYGDQIDQVMKPERDFIFHHFGVKTLIKTPYLICRKENIREHREVVKKNVAIETPQHMWMRVALGIWGNNIEEAFKVYEALSTGKSIFASPTLFSSGTTHPTLSSCFLLKMKGDNLGNIFDTVKDCAMISKNAGGIGVAVSNIRSKGSFIGGTNGTSNGIKPMLKVLNNVARYVDQCFTPDTLMLTEKGAIPMGEVMPNDSVLTKDGTMQRVLETIHHPYKGPILNIDTKYSIDNVKVTPEHPLYLIRANGMLMREVRKRLDKGFLSPEFVEAKHVSKDDLLGTPIPTYSKDAYGYDLDDCRFMGIMIGDGSLSKNRKEGKVYLNSSSKIVTYDFCKEYLEARGIHTWTHKSENRDCLALGFTPPSHMKLNRNMIYDSEGEKCIPSFALHLPLEKVKHLLKGLIETDGSLSDDRIRIEMTSRNVIEGIRYLCLRLGIPTSGTVRDRLGQVSESKHGDIITKKISYDLRIPKAPQLCDILGVTPGKIFRYYVRDNIIYSRVNNITTEQYDGETIDFLIENNHNYVASHLGLVKNGGGKRKGAFAVYLEPWHSDVEDFLQLKLPHGSEEDRARDLFYALWCPDLFFERVSQAFKTGKEVLWSLLDPKVCSGLDEVWGKDFTELYEKYEKEGKYVKQVSIRTLWKQILETQKATGTPYILSKGNVNKYSMHSHLGTIKSSNLCVAGDTKILTSAGYKTIKALKDQQVKIWNGELWSTVTIRQTSDSSQLVRVSFSDGGYLDCTEYHKFYIKEDGKEVEIQASDLKPGKTLIDWKFETSVSSEQKIYPFTTYEDAFEHRLQTQALGYKSSIALQDNLWKVTCNDCSPVKVEKVSLLCKGPTYCFNEPLRHKGVFNGYLTGQCSEIVEYTSEDQTAVCNLSSIPIGNYVKDGKFDYQGLYDTTRLMIRSLNRVIDVTKYPVPESHKSNMNHRPVGLGVSGVANAHFKLRIPFDSPEALDFHHKFSETMYFAALTESHQLALEQGPFDSFKGSKLSQGLFHWEQWQGQFKPENEWMNTKPHPELKWDWEDLREKVKKDGVRNSLLIAYMPTASTGQICNMWEGAELPYTLPCARKTKSGEFTQWEREMVMDFIRLKLWKTVENPDNGEQTIPLMNAIILNQGSLQITQTTPKEARPYLEQIPPDLCRLYQGAFDVSGEVHRKLFRVKAPWIDQTMSFNIYFKTKDEMMVDMTKHLLKSWKMGLKTISYYTRTLQQTDTVNVSKVKELEKPKKKPRKMLIVNSGDVCVSCS